MAKFALLFVAAVAVAVVADHQQQTRQVQDMVRRMKEKSNNLGGLIQTFQADNTEGRRFMTYQANDFAHCIQNVVYKMQQTAQNTQGEHQKKIKEMAGKLGEHAYAIRQAMNSEPNQMKAQLKTQVQNIADEAEKMKQFIDQHAQEDGRQVNDEMKQAVSDLMAAIKKMHVQMECQKKSHEEIDNKMQTVAGQMSMYTQNVKTYDEQTAKDMIHQAQQFAHMMTEMVDKIEREADKQEGQTKEEMRQLAKKMIETYATLEKASNIQGDAKTKVEEMKSKLPAAVQEVAAETRIMMQFTKSNAQDEHMKLVVKCVMTDAVAATENMQAQLQVITENNKN